MVEVDKTAKIVRVSNRDVNQAALSFERVNGNWEAWLGQNLVKLSNSEMGQLIEGLQELRAKG